MDIQEIGRQNRAIPGWIRIMVMAPLLGLASYWTFGYYGLYRLLAEYQIDLFDEYIPFVTGALTYITLIIPVFPIFRILRKYYNAPAEEKLPGKLKLLEQRFPSMLKAMIVLGSIGGVTFVIGTYMFISSWLYGSLKPIQLTDLKKDTVAAKYVEFTANEMHAYGYGMTETNGGRKTSYMYVPVYSDQLEKIAHKPYCIVEFYENDYNDLRESDAPYLLKGTISKNSLPGLIREQMKNHLNENYWVLKFNHDPATDEAFGTIMLVISLTTGIIFFFVRKRGLNKVVEL